MTIAEYDTVSISPPTGTVPPAVVPSLGAVISLRLGAAILRTGADRLGVATERPSPLADQVFPVGACLFLSLSILQDVAFLLLLELFSTFSHLKGVVLLSLGTMPLDRLGQLSQPPEEALAR